MATGYSRIQEASQIFLVAGYSLLDIGEFTKSGSDVPHLFCICRNLNVNSPLKIYATSLV